MTTVALAQVGTLQNVSLAITGTLYGKKWGKSHEETYHNYLKHIAARGDRLNPGPEWKQACGKAGVPFRIHGDGKSKYTINNKPFSWWVSFGTGSQGGPNSRIYTLVHGGTLDGTEIFTARFTSQSIDKDNSVLDLNGFKAELKAAFEALKLKDGIFEPEL